MPSPQEPGESSRLAPVSYLPGAWRGTVDAPASDPEAETAGPSGLGRQTPLHAAGLRDAEGDEAGSGGRDWGAWREAGPIGAFRAAEAAAALEPVSVESGGERPRLRVLGDEPAFLQDVADGGEIVGEEQGESQDSLDARVEEFSMPALGRRAYAVRELRELLIAKGVSEHVAEAECERLGRVGLLDDDQLAEDLVERLQRRKGLGRTALVQELKQRKLAPESINHAIALLDNDEELERAVALAVKKAGAMSGLEPDAARRRLHGFLQRRGYDSTTISRAVDLALRGARSRSLPPRRDSPASRVSFRPD